MTVWAATLLHEFIKLYSTVEAAKIQAKYVANPIWLKSRLLFTLSHLILLWKAERNTLVWCQLQWTAMDSNKCGQIDQN